jgi:hypothetical protein
MYNILDDLFVKIQGELIQCSEFGRNLKYTGLRNPLLYSLLS